MEIKLQTTRLYMREFTLADAEILYQMHQDPAITQFTGDPISWDSIEMVEKIITEALMLQYQFGIGRWACYLIENKEFIGWCGLKKVGDQVDLGYRFIQKYWGKGYATEAAKAVLEFGIKNKIPNIIGRAAVENTASVKVLQKIGLTFKEYYFEEGEKHQSIKLEWIY